VRWPDQPSVNLSGMIGSCAGRETASTPITLTGMSPEVEQLRAALDRSMGVDPSVPLRTVRADYRAACAASKELIAAIADADAPVTRNGKTHPFRWVLLAVIEETARHAGHADIIREQIDGRTGR
jgi:hypothetical protein